MLVTEKFPARAAIVARGQFALHACRPLVFGATQSGNSRVAHVFGANEFNADPRYEIRTAMDAAAARLGVTIVRIPVHDNAEVEPAISAFAAAPHGGLLVTGATLNRFEAIKRLALPDRLGSLEIHHQLEFGWKLDRQLAHLCAAQDAIHIGCSTPD
jgi:hypothetical protein